METVLGMKNKINKFRETMGKARGERSKNPGKMRGKQGEQNSREIKIKPRCEWNKNPPRVALPGCHRCHPRRC